LLASYGLCLFDPTFSVPVIIACFGRETSHD
jgi:hypothetical protein